jgi:hypothetical protein
MQRELKQLGLNAIAESFELHPLILYDTRAMGSSLVDAQRVFRQYSPKLMVFREYRTEYATSNSKSVNGLVVWTLE